MKHSKIQKKITGLMALSLAFLSWGCESFIEIDLPDSQLTGDIVFNELGTAEAAVTNMYGKLTNNVLLCGNSNGLSILLGSYADELDTYNSGILEFDFFQNSLTSTNAAVSSLWNGSYNLIYAANAVIEGLENSTALSPEDKDRLKGEALFLRAYIHFHLINLFGEIPYVTTTDYAINASVTKLPIPEIYTILLEDLEEAEYLTPNSTAPLRLRPSLDTIRALLARIHLYMENWQSAEMYASLVIGSENLNWVDALDEVFSKNSTATIWQLMREEGFPTHEAQSFIFTMGPPPNRALNMQLVNAFEPQDLRREQWVGSVSDQATTWYFPHKYKQAVAEPVSREYSILFRLEEMYLIRAEAQAHLGDFASARNDINKIRNRAGLGNISVDSESELIAAVVQERRIEYFSELGHRFFDLKRTGMIEDILAPVKPGWDPNDKLWPLPESELLLNPNLLPQNPGY